MSSFLLTVALAADPPVFELNREKKHSHWPPRIFHESSSEIRGPEGGEECPLHWWLPPEPPHKAAMPPPQILGCPPHANVFEHPPCLPSLGPHWGSVGELRWRWRIFHLDALPRSMGVTTRTLLDPLSSCLSEARDKAFNLPESRFPPPYKRGIPGVPTSKGFWENQNKIFIGTYFINYNQWISTYCSVDPGGSPKLFQGVLAIEAIFVRALGLHSLFTGLTFTLMVQKQWHLSLNPGGRGH